MGVFFNFCTLLFPRYPPTLYMYLNYIYEWKEISIYIKSQFALRVCAGGGGIALRIRKAIQQNKRRICFFLSECRCSYQPINLLLLILHHHVFTLWRKKTKIWEKGKFLPFLYILPFLFKNRFSISNCWKWFALKREPPMLFHGREIHRS